MLRVFFVFFIAMIVISQYRLFRASRQLSFAQIVFEFNLSTRQNLIYSIAILIGIIIIIVFPTLLSWLLLLLIVLTFGTWVQLSIYQRLKEKNYPKQYLKYFLICSFITYLAEIGLLVCFFLST